MDSTKERLILETAEVLLKENGTLTTLDLKTELRNLYPDESWNQDEISFQLMAACGRGNINGKELAYHDTGRYRVYAFRGVTKGNKKLVTKTKLAVILSESTGKEVTVQFFKKDGSLRTIVGIIGNANVLGYFEIKEVNGDGNPRLIDSRSIQLVEVDGEKYHLKS